MSANDIEVVGQKLINAETINGNTLAIEARNLALEARNLALASGGSDHQAKEEARIAKKELDSLKLHYQLLLAKPMHQIAELSGDFRKTYEAQQLLMAEWMVSQKAFKELAIQYGTKAGKTADEIMQEGLEKEIDVLESKHNPEHNTNSNNSSIIRPRVDALKRNYYANKK